MVSLLRLAKLKKMSKSKNNGVDPQAIIDAYGADTARLYMLFTAPADQTLEWSDSALKGPYNFIKKVWRLSYDHLAAINALGINLDSNMLDITTLDKATLSKDAKNLRKKVHETLAKIDVSLGEHLALNTPVSALMELTNELSSFHGDTPTDLAVRHECLLVLLTLLAIFAPHVGEILLEAFGVDTRTLSYPTIDASALVSDSITMAVQVNGKVRGQMEVPVGTDVDTIKKMALDLEAVQKFITGDIKKQIVVPNKLVSIVV